MLIQVFTPLQGNYFPNLLYPPTPIPLDKTNLNFKISISQLFNTKLRFTFQLVFLGFGMLHLKENTFLHFALSRAPIRHILDQIRSVAQLCPTLCNPMNRSTPGLPVHHQLPEFTQTHVHRVSDAIQPSHPLSAPSPPAPNPSQHQSLFQWVNSSHEVAKILEFQLSHHSL